MKKRLQDEGHDDEMRWLDERLSQLHRDGEPEPKQWLLEDQLFTQSALVARSLDHSLNESVSVPVDSDARDLGTG